jgi:hypothetical protein
LRNWLREQKIDSVPQVRQRLTAASQQQPSTH